MKLLILFLMLVVPPKCAEAHGGRTNKEGCHRKFGIFKHCHKKEAIKKMCVWKQYIVPEAKGYKTCTINPSPKNPYSWETCGIKGGAPLLVNYPLPPTPQVKYKDYKNCEWIELNDAVRIARPIARELQKGRNAGGRANIMNLSTRRGVKIKSKQLGGGKEAIYIPKPMLDELIANWREEEKRYPR